MNYTTDTHDTDGFFLQSARKKQQKWEDLDRRKKDGEELTAGERHAHLMLPVSVNKMLQMHETWLLQQAEKKAKLATVDPSYRAYGGPRKPRNQIKTGPGGILDGYRDLGQLMQSGLEEVDMLLQGRLYREGIHVLFGPHAAGKSIIALRYALDVISQDEHVVYLDEEMSYRQQVKRLVKMGADPDQISTYFHWFAGTGITTDPDSINVLKHTVEEYGPSLVIFDSLIDFLGLAGLDENSSNDVSGWFGSVANPLKNDGRAILILDHANREGQYRGSSAKPAAADVFFEVKVLEAFEPGTMGRVKIHMPETGGKDREGLLPKSTVYDIGDPEPNKLICEPADAVRIEHDGLIARDRTALDAIRREAAPDGPGISRAEWIAASGLPARTLDRARETLVGIYVEKVNDTYRPVDQQRLPNV